MANFVLTEEQYKMALENGVLSEEAESKTVVDGNGSPNVGSEVEKAIRDTNASTIEVTNFGNGNGGNEHSTSVYEGTLISKKELKERRLERLCENSEIISVKSLFGL